MKHCTITVRNIDSKLFHKQRVALIRLMDMVENRYKGKKVPAKVASDLELLEGLLCMTDHMADRLDILDGE